MKSGPLIRSVGVLLTGIVACASFTAAQVRRPQTASENSSAVYDKSREVTLQGTVASFTANSETGPAGAHVVLQTSSGEVDVHLGDAQFLQKNNFSITQGGSLRVVGENVTLRGETVFLARVVQQSSQSLTVRTDRGFPLSRARSQSSTSTTQQGGPR